MTTGVDLRDLRREFPLTEEWTYLNHAAHGPFPQRTVQAVKAYAESWANPATYDSARNEIIQRETRQWLADAGFVVEAVEMEPTGIFGVVTARKA